MTGTLLTDRPASPPGGPGGGAPSWTDPRPRPPADAGRTGGDPSPLLGVAAGVATALGSLAFVPVFAASDWIGPVLGAVVVVASGGLLLRAVLPASLAGLRRGAPGRENPERRAALGVAVVPLVQVVLLFTFLTWVFAPQHTTWGLIPTPGSTADLLDVLRSGGPELRQQATPALTLDGLVALTAAAVGLVALAVDLVAAGAQQPALGGIGLLVLYCVPVSTVIGDVGLLSFLGPAAGFGVLLWADQRARLADRVRSGPGAALGTGTLAALRTGVVALVAGVLLPLVLPTLAEGSLAKQFGEGSGAGGTGTRLDPFAELQGELTLPTPIPLLSVQTSVEDPGYLRAVSLDEYGPRGWGLSGLDGDRAAQARGSLAALPTGTDSRPVTATVTVRQHDDRFLPLLSSPLTLQIDGDRSSDWRFDGEGSTVFGRGTTTAGRTYQETAAEPRPTEAQLEAGGEPAVDSAFMQRYTALPQLSPVVLDLAARLTAGAGTPYDRVRAINDYLSDRANGFVYDLSTDPGTSGDDLVDFLQSKQGYCEQYAGAMAVLVRAAGVPARVVLGYTPGEVQADGTRLVTSDDAHAWVEAWFNGIGWVPFDPTPISAQRAVVLPWAPRADAPTATAPEVPDTVPAPAPAPAPASAQLGEDDEFVPVATPASESGTAWRGWAIGVGASVLLLGVLAAPAAARSGQRRRRQADGRPGALWDELMATAEDLGIPVLEARTPRQTAQQLAELVAPLEPDAVAAVHELAVAEEGTSYGPPGVVRTGPAVALGTARRGLVRATPRVVWLRAVLWPTSTVRPVAARITSLLGRSGRPRAA